MATSPPMPTDAELAILRVLWARGPSTVRAVQTALDDEAARSGPVGYTKPVGYTTVLKMLQIMLEKGLVTRDESQRAHVYAAAVAEADAQRRLVDDLLDRAFGGSARKLVMQALASERVAPGELDQIRALIDQLEHDQNGEDSDFEPNHSSDQDTNSDTNDDD